VALAAVLFSNGRLRVERRFVVLTGVKKTNLEIFVKVSRYEKKKKILMLKLYVFY